MQRTVNPPPYGARLVRSQDTPPNTIMTTIHISELPIDAQDNLRKTYHQYYINVDPVTHEQYIRFMGENVALSSIKQSQVLLG